MDAQLRDKQAFFSEKLLQWFATNHREMPWKGVKNPYFVWLSEIILQQTTVRQGLPYYERFVAQYPSVFDLANAPEDDVMKLWEGLGYYSRARNLHATAKHVAFALDGQFPNTYEALLQLKGVGAYTAAAIASFAFDLPHAVVDGNVFRVLSRFFGVEEPIDSPKAKALFTELANAVLVTSRPADFNQAIMDFGATLCVPANPPCAKCPMQTQCTAFRTQKVGELPIKSKKMVKKDRFFNYLVLNTEGSVFIRKRTEKDIWQNLYEFPLVETGQMIDQFSDLKPLVASSVFGNVERWILVRKSAPMRQLLTHQRVFATFWEIDLGEKKSENWADFMPIERGNLVKFAFPKVIDAYLNEKTMTLF